MTRAKIGRFRTGLKVKQRQRSSQPWGTCTRVSELEFGSNSPRFFVRDGSDYQAHLHTRADFGCVEHTEPVLGAP